MEKFNKVDFLLKPRILGVLGEMRSIPLEGLQVNRDKILKDFAPRERLAIVEQLHLRDKAKTKWENAENLLFTKLGLEQSSQQLIGQYKAKKLGEQGTVVDLCCGIGGDSFYLNAKRLIGVDWDVDTLRLYRNNLNCFGRATATVCADVGSQSFKADVALLDPARRNSNSSNRWGTKGLSPDLSAIEKIIETYGNVALKLGPGMDLPEFLTDWNVEYLGIGDTCLEVLVWTGDLGKRGKVSVTELKSGEHRSYYRDDVLGSFDRVEEPGEFLYEPIKAVVRSHLFGCLAAELNLWQLDSRTAYLSGNEKIRHPFLKGYRIVEQVPFNMKVIRKTLLQREIGRLEVKKRGVALIPEKVRSDLKLRGTQSAVLIFTRQMNQKTAFITEPL